MSNDSGDAAPTALHLVCNRPDCGHEFFETPDRLKRGNPILCLGCGAVVAASYEEALQLHRTRVPPRAD